ncbi:MAG: purine-nucleoside phosphorylase [Bacteroidota bacterium]|jgi:purine-nucleoside phosphorylase|nr:purine-nucleoside phosphorylase [Bacteroidota bacterium]
MIKEFQETINYIRSVTKVTPRFGIILGTGLGGLIDQLDLVKIIPYKDIPHFPVSTVESHSGKLIIAKLHGKVVVVMQGRFHYYEGYNMNQITYPIRVMKLLGIQKLFISNAAGALNPDYEVSDLMILEDHINLMPENPLTGKNLDEFGPRFPDMSEPYSQRLIEQAINIAEKYSIRVHQGVYAAVPGPNLETRAEYRYLRIIGADAVGMSTVPENIVARHMNIPCFAISVITDLCTEGNIKPVTVEEIIEAAKTAEPVTTKIITELIAFQEEA